MVIDMLLHGLFRTQCAEAGPQKHIQKCGSKEHRSHVMVVQTKNKRNNKARESSKNFKA